MIFEFNGGDGDQAYFGQPFTALRVERPWFLGKLPRGEAWLLQIQDGFHAGKYISITSRVLFTLDEQIQDNFSKGVIEKNWISVVVHSIIGDVEKFIPDDDHAHAIGMAVIRCL